MQSAVLLLVASGMGVTFGWQPMPDGSPSYEYVVQLEPELVATLKEGQSIPISGEVPEEIRPISRVRVVVGTDPLPRRQLTTALKPVAQSTEKKPLDGVVQTQYTVPPVQPTGVNRYAMQPQANQQILPPPSNSPSAGQGLTRTIQNGAQQLTQPISDLADQAKSILPQPGNNNLGNSLNTAAQNINNSIQGTAQNLGNQLRNSANEILPDPNQLFNNGADAIRQPLNQAGQQLQNAIGNVGQQAQDTFNRFTNQQNRSQPTSDGFSQPAGQTNSSILPPGENDQQSNFADNTTRPRKRVDEPVGTQSSQTNWQSTPGANQFGQSSNNPSNTNNQNNYGSQWNNNQPTHSTQDTLSAPPYANSNPPNPFSDNRLASKSDFNTPDSQIQGPTIPNLVDDTTGNSRVPGISKDGLSKPADAPFETASTTSGNPMQPQQPLYHTNLPNQSPAAQQAGPQLANGNSAQQNGWDRLNQTSTQQGQNKTNEPKSTTETSLLVFAWVLLSGSVFGNAYLLFNYFDVRNKYRGMVYNNRDSNRSYASFD